MHQQGNNPEFEALVDDLARFERQAISSSSKSGPTAGKVR